MSAPQTNIEKQKRWHRAPLIGMVVVVVFGVAMIFFWLMHESGNSNPPKLNTQTQGQANPAEPAVAAPTPAPDQTAPAQPAEPVAKSPVVPAQPGAAPGTAPAN